jgi:hypothetical protein
MYDVNMMPCLLHSKQSYLDLCLCRCLIVKKLE